MPLNKTVFSILISTAVLSYTQSIALQVRSAGLTGTYFTPPTSNKELKYGYTFTLLKPEYWSLAT